MAALPLGEVPGDRGPRPSRSPGGFPEMAMILTASTQIGGGVRTEDLFEAIGGPKSTYRADLFDFPRLATCRHVSRVEGPSLYVSDSPELGSRH